MTLLPKGVNMKAIPLSAFDSATGLLTTSNARTRYVSVNYAEHPQPKYGQCGAGNREDNGREMSVVVSKDVLPYHEDAHIQHLGSSGGYSMGSVGGAGLERRTA